VSELINRDQEGPQPEFHWDQHLQVGTERLPKFWVKFGEVVVSRKAGPVGAAVHARHWCTTLPSLLDAACPYFVQLWALNIPLIMRIVYNLDQISKRDAAGQRGFSTGNQAASPTGRCRTAPTACNLHNDFQHLLT
jgi:hypothetical protein